MHFSHATCVALAGQGVLLRGPSGAGKSDLALRLIDGGGALVAVAGDSPCARKSSTPLPRHDQRRDFCCPFAFAFAT